MIETSLANVARIIGGRVSGASTDLRVRGVSIDSRTCEAGDLFFAIRGERFDGHDYAAQAISNGAVACVVSRLVEDAGAASVVVQDPLTALGRLAAQHRRDAGAIVVAITGSNGKTTTKGMAGQVLSSRRRGRAAVKSFNNHVGVPLTLLAVQADDEFVVSEIGSNAPGEIDDLARIAAPEIGVITSVGPAHLEGFGSLAGVIREKTSLLRHVRDGGLAVVNADHAGLLEAAEEVLAHRPGAVELVTFGESATADLRICEVQADLRGIRFRIDNGSSLQVPVCGAHNALNATAVLAVARRLGMTDDEIADGLAAFRSADMRLNVIEAGDVTVINDGYNANPASMRAAIGFLAGLEARRRVLVVGDMLELGREARAWHEEIGRQVASAGIELTVAAGQQAPAVVSGATEGEVVACADVDAACEAVGSRLRAGDVVLVKGSRAMRMERVVDAIINAWRRPGDHAAAARAVAY